ncbi:transcription elongation factor Spt5 [Schizophyllum commune Tattone D]|nr:transcription elongation factor Spt5 [Schizophyllum commune Tattone D]
MGHGEEPADKSKQRAHFDEEEEEEEEEERDPEEEEDEEDEEEEEEEEAQSGRRRKRAKHSHKKRGGAHNFLDIEAEVSDDEEEEEEEEGFGLDGFIERNETFDDEGGATHHARLNTRRELEQEDLDPEQIAKNLSKRYGNRAYHKYTGDMNEVPQHFLMPDVDDPNLWLVRVKPGKERDIVFSLMRKAIDLEFQPKPLQIYSAFYRESLQGYVYIEARSSRAVSHAINGLIGIFPTRGITLVPIDEMTSLLQLKQKDLNITPGMWVRLKKPLKYAGDLAQVIDVTENGEEAGLRLIPRIDMRPPDEAPVDGNVKKRKKTAGPGVSRPPQALFNVEAVQSAYGGRAVITRPSTTGRHYIFAGDTYKNGFLEKDFKLSWISTEDANPSLDEITQFTRGMSAGEDGEVNLTAIAEASRKAATLVLQPGDQVEVFEGAQAGLQGMVEEIRGDIITISAGVGSDVEGQKIEVTARSVRKRFKPGDHVKVMAGQNADETGLVVSVSDNVVTFVSDMTMKEVSVFSKDLREAAEVGTSTNIVGDYELHDLVQLEYSTVGVIFRTERDSFWVLDQNGQKRMVQPHQIAMRRDSRHAIAADNTGHELRIQDMVKEVDGEGRKGRVLHIHQSFYAFLHNREIPENGGIFVTKTRSLAPVTPRNEIKASTDLSKMNPALSASMAIGQIGRGPRDRDIGLHVCIIKGPQKGYYGRIKDTNGNLARVELTGNKIISIDKSKLAIKEGNQMQALGDRNRPRRTNMGPPSNNMASPSVNPYISQTPGTPMWGSASRTPNPYMNNGGRTPAWSTNSRTPNPYQSGSGSKTPAWSTNSKTPNPYANDGGRTPAWQASSRTPNPYAQGGGSASGGGSSGWGSSGGGNWGGSTPATAWGNSSSNDAWSLNNGGQSPTWNQTAPTPGYSAATPAATAPTPAAAPTPYPSGMLSAETPAASAPTPAPSGHYMDDQEDDDGSPGENWMFDPALAQHARSLRVQIQGTLPDNYLGGRYEGQTGTLDGIMRMGRDHEQTLRVVFDHEADGVGNRNILAKYIIPLRPTANQQIVTPMSGSHKGEVWTISDLQHDETNCTLYSRELGEFIVEKVDEIVQLKV